MPIPEYPNRHQPDADAYAPSALESDTDLEKSDFDVAVDDSDVITDDTSGSEVVLLEDEDAPKARPKGKEPAAPALTGTRVDGLLLHVVDPPHNGVCTCRLYNRYRVLPQRDGLTAGVRCASPQSSAT